MLTPEQLNKWRIVPRALMGMYMYVLYETQLWFVSLNEPNNAQAAFAAAIIGAGAAWFSIYVNPKDK